MLSLCFTLKLSPVYEKTFEYSKDYRTWFETEMMHVTLDRAQ